MKILEKPTYVIAEMPSCQDRDLISAIRADLTALVQETGKDLVLDMQKATHLYSAGAGLIADLCKQTMSANLRLFVVNVNGDVDVTLRGLRMDLAIAVFETMLEFEMEREWDLEQKASDIPLQTKAA